MKREVLCLAAVVGLLAGGCTTHTTVYVPAPPPVNVTAQPAVPPPELGGPAEGTVVETPPPDPQVEVYVPPPAPGYVWTAGYWYWGGGRWAWAPGRWLYPPFRGAHWAPGRWDRRYGRAYWVRGRWR